MKQKIPLLIFLVVLISCEYYRAPVPEFSFKLKSNDEAVREDTAYFDACAFGTVEELEKFLKEGCDPDYVKPPSWGIPWHESNPLWGIFNYDKVALLIKYGADVTKRPYIAKVVDSRIISEKYPDRAMLLDFAGKQYEKEVFTLVKLYLEAGADPNLKGMAAASILSVATDKNYKKYYDEHGWLPINFAIEKNAFSIVDLLLEHGAYLDDQSFLCGREATERSGSAEMENYIRVMWEKQTYGK
jgi:hypothetical protein